MKILKEHNKSVHRKKLSFFRIISAVLLIGSLILIVGELAKYLYQSKAPDYVSLKIKGDLTKVADGFVYAKNYVSGLIGADYTDKINSKFRLLGLKFFAKQSYDQVDVGDANDMANTAQNFNDQEVPEVAGVKSSRSVGKEDMSIIKVALVSDAHGDWENLARALDKAKKLNADKVVFLGDYTDWGDLDNLAYAKKIMDASGLDYVSLPGDHDLGQTRDESNFIEVFGHKYGVFYIKGVKFMFFDNSKNFTKIPQSDLAWFRDEIKDTQFLFLSQPLMTRSMNRVMGIIDGVRDLEVFSQNQELLSLIRNSQVKVIMAGDLHYFSQFGDPVKPSLWHYSVGAVLRTQGLEKINLQDPRFSILDIKEDTSYEVADIPID